MKTLLKANDSGASLILFVAQKILQ